MKTYWVYCRIGRQCLEYKVSLTIQPSDLRVLSGRHYKGWEFAGHIKAHNRADCLLELKKYISNTLAQKENLEFRNKKTGLQSAFI